MYTRLVARSFVRNPRRKLLAALSVLLGMAAATATLTVTLNVGDELAQEFQNFGANILVRSKTDSLPLEIGGVDYRPVDEGAWLPEASLGKLKTIFWRHNITGFTPFLELPVLMRGENDGAIRATLIGTWYDHGVLVPDGSVFRTGLFRTHPYWKVEGQWFGDAAQECEVGEALAARAGIHAGETLRLEAGGISRDLKVVGILSTGGSEDQALVAPLAIAQELSNHPGQFRTLFVSAVTKPEDALSQQNPQTMSPAEYDRWYCSPYISSIGHQIEQVIPGTEAQPIRRLAETEGRILTHVAALFWLVTLAALGAAILAVSAISVTTVLERQPEIGLMKAMGAGNGFLSALFLGESFLVGLLGGSVGYVAGLGLARELGKTVFGMPASPRWIVLPVVMGLALGVSFLGSVLPLRRLAHFDPAVTLRGE